MNSPLVSVIVPIYNTEKYLNACVRSILSQTYTNFEVLLINDGSPDNSGVICDQYAQEDSRVRVFHNENKGAGATREFGVKNSTAKWVIFVDSDDTLPERCLEELLRLDDGFLDIISGISYNTVSRTFYKHINYGIMTKQEYICALLSGKTIDGPWAKIIKRDLFNNYNFTTPKNIRQNEDMLMLIALANNSTRLLMSNDIIAYNYVSRPNSARTSLMPLRSWLELFGYIENLLKNYNDRQIRKSFMTYCLLRLRYCHNAGMFTPLSNPYVNKIFNESADFADDAFITESRKHISSLLLQFIEIIYVKIRHVAKTIRKIIRRM